VFTAPAGHAASHQVMAEILDLEAGQRALDLGAQHGGILQACGVRAEARIFQQILALHLPAEAAKLAVVDDAEKELAVAGRELVVRRDVGVGAAETPRGAA
jgi:hypothetical protein